MRKVSAKAVKRYEARQVARIQKWQGRRPGWVARATGYLTSPVVWVFRNVIPHGAVEATLHGNLRLARGWARERATLRALGASSYAAPTEAEQLFIYYTLPLAGNRKPEAKEVSLQAMRELQTLIASNVPVAASDHPIAPTARHKAFSIVHHDFSREITKQLVEVRLMTAIPVIGAVIGVIVDANYIRSVGWAARHAYQLRWLRERRRWLD